MKTNFILTLKSKSGLLSPIQSDTVYGHFCWRLKDNFGEQILKEFISRYQNDKPVFLLSDGLIKIGEEIRFPKPYMFTETEYKKNKKDRIIEFVDKKRNREKDYFTISEMNTFLSSGPELSSKNPKGLPKSRSSSSIISDQLRVSVRIDRNNLASEEGKLFSYKPKYFGDDIYFIILIKILDNDAFAKYSCATILKEVFQLGYGKKKSSGFGQFEVIGDIVEFDGLIEPDKSDHYLILGNYLPSDKDGIVPIGYDINTKFGKLGEELSQSKNPFKNPIVFLTAGSCFKSINDRDFFGRVTSDGEISKLHSYTVQFGCPFFLKFKGM